MFRRSSSVRGSFRISIPKLASRLHRVVLPFWVPACPRPPRRGNSSREISLAAHSERSVPAQRDCRRQIRAAQRVGCSYSRWGVAICYFLTEVTRSGCAAHGECARDGERRGGVHRQRARGTDQWNLAPLKFLGMSVYHNTRRYSRMTQIDRNRGFGENFSRKYFGMQRVLDVEHAAMARWPLRLRPAERAHG